MSLPHRDLVFIRDSHSTCSFLLYHQNIAGLFVSTNLKHDPINLNRSRNYMGGITRTTNPDAIWKSLAITREWQNLKHDHILNYSQIIHDYRLLHQGPLPRSIAHYGMLFPCHPVELVGVWPVSSRPGGGCHH
ncbi:hypothetical protein JAAARDRAFT_34917 [Jaapia argillacea MUCL 33604]|uniref:Uncharacterized protein n=1 Tax=Jaapia argillacea MUCL 33604 TaxID=933084 RepID=A0A067Q674_9AGAM|nr:hypothetical protein JAAARDRAFT_34917 [Jaapia argillacea MUCL 33604]